MYSAAITDWENISQDNVYHDVSTTIIIPLQHYAPAVFCLLLRVVHLITSLRRPLHGPHLQHQEKPPPSLEMRSFCLQDNPK